MSTHIVTTDDDIFERSKSVWWPSWLQWLPTSEEKLKAAENMIFRRLNCRLDDFFLSVFDGTYSLRTIVARNYPANSSTNLNPEQRTPIVLIHGFASGVGLWCKNIDSLSRSRRVYAFDMLGFGRSSRPDFPTNAEDVELRFVEILEEWRTQMNLDKFILVGHSLGGYIAAAYATFHADRVKHLILVDPWGFVGQTESSMVKHNYGLKYWILRKLTSFRALSAMRFIGPFGPNVMRSFRQDFEHVFYQIPQIGDEIEIIPLSDDSNECEPASSSFETSLTQSVSKLNLSKHTMTRKELSSISATEDTISPFDPSVIYNYVYHINARYPSGEDAFLHLSPMMGWAARPMLPRLPGIASSLPITFIYGGRSWVDLSTGLRARSLRSTSYVDVMVIEGGGHHAYAQYADEFNIYVNAVASLVDEDHCFSAGSEALVHEVAAAISSHPTGGRRRRSQDVSPTQQQHRTVRQKRRSVTQRNKYTDLMVTSDDQEAQGSHPYFAHFKSEDIDSSKITSPDLILPLNNSPVDGLSFDAGDELSA